MVAESVSDREVQLGDERELVLLFHPLVFADQETGIRSRDHVSGQGVFSVAADTDLLSHVAQVDLGQRTGSPATS